MKIIDCIYGEHEVEPIIEKLINTKTMQRLKNIHQGGGVFLVNNKCNGSRYEHSIGAMLFIKIMGGTVEEQIAGLLHDISHTAFSHVIDFVFDNKNEDYHEKIYEKIIESSDIPKILEENGYDFKDIVFNEEKWTILEKSLPKLCADRVDYTLRDMYHYGTISKEEINNFLKDVTVFNGEVVITSIESTKWFVNTYYKEVIDYFMNPMHIYANDRLAKGIKLALNLNYIKEEDLLEDDEYILNLLKNCNSEEVRSLINSINKDANIIEDEKRYGIFRKNKLRIIDPSILIDGKLFKASEKIESIKDINKKALKKASKGVYIKILD